MAVKWVTLIIVFSILNWLVLEQRGKVILLDFPVFMLASDLKKKKGGVGWWKGKPGAAEEVFFNILQQQNRAP